jgi:hypothetical protein
MLQNFASSRLRAAFLGLAIMAVGVCVVAVAAGPAAAQNAAGISFDRVTPTQWKVPLAGAVTGRVDYKDVNVAGMIITTRVLIGLRDPARNWVGSAPQLLAWETIFAPPDTYVQHADELFTLVAPTTAGNYKVWLYATTATSLAAAEAEFKDPLLAANGAVSVIVGDVSVGQPTGNTASIKVDPSSVTGMPWMAGTDINGTFAFSMWRGDNPVQNCIVTVGLRDMTGNWIGADPVVVQNVVPLAGPPGQSYTNNKITNLATPPGVLSFVWVHLSEAQTDPLVAIQDFKTAKPTVEGPLDGIVGVVIGPANGLLITQASPNQWSLKAPGGKPASISGSMTVQMQLPAGEFITKLYMVVVGIRNDGTGAWVGGEPKIIAQDSPPWDLPHVFTKRGFAGLALPAAGAGPGPFSVWARMIQTTSTKVAIKDFKISIVLAEDDRNRRVGAILVPIPGVRVTNPNPTAWICPRQVQPWVTGSATIQMWNGRDQNLVQKVVVGIRDAVGASVGGAPQVILTDVPPSDQPGKTYDKRQWYKINTLKLAPGAYTVWVRLVQTTKDAAAIKAYKVVIPVPDPELDGFVGGVTVP